MCLSESIYKLAIHPVTFTTHFFQVLVTSFQYLLFLLFQHSKQILQLLNSVALLASSITLEALPELFNYLQYIRNNTQYDYWRSAITSIRYLKHVCMLCSIRSSDDGFEFANKMDTVRKNVKYVVYAFVYTRPFKYLWS